MAALDTPPPVFKAVHIATIRRLIREGWIARIPVVEDELGRDNTWCLTTTGNALLHRNKEYLEPASREAQQHLGQAVLRQIAIAQKPERLISQRDWAAEIEWTKEGIRAAGFRGFIPFRTLPVAQVPRRAGVYVVLRLSALPPAFREVSVAGTYKGRAPSVGLDELSAMWIADVPVLYIGKAEFNSASSRGLAKRLDEYRRHGLGESIGHWGGRYIWQLEDSDDFVVAWMETPTNGAEELESALLDSFVQTWGALPFANLKRGRAMRGPSVLPSR